MATGLETTEKIYFFKGHSYWKFNPERKHHMRTDRYPKSISEWDLPAYIEGAMQWVNGRTYFFKYGQYWRFKDRQFTVDLASPEFPRQTAQWWFGSPTTSPLAEGHSGEVTLSEEMDGHESGNSFLLLNILAKKIWMLGMKILKLILIEAKPS